MGYLNPEESRKSTRRKSNGQQHVHPVTPATLPAWRWDLRQTGIVVRGSPCGMNCFSELAFPPFGYVITKEEMPPDKRLQDITFFSRFSFNDWKQISLKLPLLPVASWIPADYRTKDELEKDVAKNKQSKGE
jgi:hypothetical protein